ncbi:hypothetical protein [Fischerella thermalis]|nr:hypothetical protein [Fischerella thermalis]
MLRCWSLVFPIIDYQLPITNYQLPITSLRDSNWYKSSNGHDIIYI